MPGEARLIEKAQDPAEVLTRLCLMQRISYWKAGVAPWQKVRSMYAAICRAIEDQEIDWLTPMHVYDSMMEIDFNSITGTSQKSKIKTKKASLKMDKDSTEL